jgi:hypothetical protein
LTHEFLLDLHWRTGLIKPGPVCVTKVCQPIEPNFPALAQRSLWIASRPPFGVGRSCRHQTPGRRSTRDKSPGSIQQDECAASESQSDGRVSPSEGSQRPCLLQLAGLACSRCSVARAVAVVQNRSLATGVPRSISLTRRPRHWAIITVRYGSFSGARMASYSVSHTQHCRTLKP